MAKIKLQRHPKLEINEVVIESTVQERMDKDEYVGLYNKKAGDATALKWAIEDAKNRLKKMDEVEATPELIEFAKKLKQASIIKDRDEMREKLQEMETTVVRLNEEVKSLQAVYDKIRTIQDTQKKL